MEQVIVLDPDDKLKLREATIRYDLAQVAGYYEREDAVQIFRDHAELIERLLEPYDVEPEERWEIDVVRGVIHIYD